MPAALIPLRGIAAPPPPQALPPDPGQGGTPFTLDAQPAAPVAATPPSGASPVPKPKPTPKPGTPKPTANTASSADPATPASQSPTAAEASPWSWLMQQLGPATADASGTVADGSAGSAGTPAHGSTAAETDAHTASATGSAAAQTAAAALAATAIPLTAGPSTAQFSVQVSADAGDAGDDAASAAPAPVALAAAGAADKPLPHAAAPEPLTPTTPLVPPAAAAMAAGVHSASTPSFAHSLGQAAVSGAAATAPSGSQSLPANQAEWPDLLADHVRWQIGHQVQEARLELHPRDLGSVQVQLRMSSSGVEVQFAAAHPQAREALAATLPQLRAMLADGGMQLAQAQVGSQSQTFQQQTRTPQRRDGGTGPSADDEAVPLSSPRVVRIGLVDDFA